MAFSDRRGFVLVFVLIVCLVLLGRWAMRDDDIVKAPARPEALASIDSPPVKARLPASNKGASDIAPFTGDLSSRFGTFRGRVVDAMTREPVREFELEFHGTQATKVGDEAPGARTFQTSDGRFAWEYLPPGNWSITASASGYQRFVLDGLLINRGHATPEIILPLRAGYTLRGRIYDEASGAGVASASVGFRESDTERFEGNWRMRVRVSSGKNGSFVLEGVPPGRVTLEIDSQHYAGRELDVMVGDRPAPLEIGLSTGGAVAGRLTAADGITPVSGSVGLFHLDQGFGSTRRTGEAGEFSFQHLRAGRYQLTGQASDGTITREVVLVGNQRMEEVVLALSAGRSIRGVVTGLHREDMKRVSISVRRDGEAANPYADVGVDDRGAYALRGVRPGRMQVVADVSMRRQLSRTIDMPANSDMSVNFDFPSGARLSGRVTRGGKPLSGVWLTPRPMVDQPVFIYGTSTSADGSYVIEDLPTGEYIVSVSDNLSRTVQVPGDTVFDIDVSLAHLSGRVIEEGSEAPVVSAEVNLWPTERTSPRIRLHDRSDHLGRFALGGLEPGDFMLTAYKPGYEMFRRRISYASPIAGVTVSLRRDVGVEVRAREAGSGKPLQQILAIEMVGDRNGSRMQLQLDEGGASYLPVALAGSTLAFSAFGYAPVVIRAWDGQMLDLQFQRQTAR